MPSMQPIAWEGSHSNSDLPTKKRRAAIFGFKIAARRFSAFELRSALGFLEFAIDLFLRLG